MPDDYFWKIVTSVVAGVPTFGASNLAIVYMLSQANGVALIGTAALSIAVFTGASFNWFLGTIG